MPRKRLTKKQRAQRYVLSQHSARDYGVKRNLDALAKDLDAVSIPGSKTKNPYVLSKRLVEGGSFDIYYGDQRERLKKFGYKVDKLSDQQIYERYTKVIQKAVGDLLYPEYRRKIIESLNSRKQV